MFSPAAIFSAVAQGMQLVQQPKFKSRFYKFPHKFGNGEGIDFPGCMGKLYEHPILITGEVHPGGRTCGLRGKDRRRMPAGDHRVVFQVTGSGKFCGALTHVNAGRGLFVKC